MLRSLREECSHLELLFRCFHLQSVLLLARSPVGFECMHPRGRTQPDSQSSWQSAGASQRSCMVRRVHERSPIWQSDSLVRCCSAACPAKESGRNEFHILGMWSDRAEGCVVPKTSFGQVEAIPSGCDNVQTLGTASSLSIIFSLLVCSLFDAAS